MPVNVILCEGNERSPDIRIISKIINDAGIGCRVVFNGSSRGFEERIRLLREFTKTSNVYGIGDLDFPLEWNSDSTMQTWIANDTAHLGWRWPRKEIENYLFDPVIVKNALDVHVKNGNFNWKEFDLDEYETELEKQRGNLAVYQAARLTLRQCGTKSRYWPSKFGKERGKHRYHFPDNLERQSIESSLREACGEFFCGITSSEQVLEKFSGTYQNEYSPGKPRYDNFLYSYAGKDIFWAMESWFDKTLFKSIYGFQEKIITGITDAPDSVVSWCSDWEDLVEKINAEP